MLGGRANWRCLQLDMRGSSATIQAAIASGEDSVLMGNGRMPAEGEALLAWMLANEMEWRETSLKRRDEPAIT